MNFKQDRKCFRKANKHFRIARRRYIRLCSKHIYIYGNEYIDYLVDKMIVRGLYSAATGERYIRQSIMNYLFKTEGRQRNCSTDEWHRWCLEKGLDPSTGYFKPIHQQSLVA